MNNILRLEWVDFAKVMAIFLVFLGHTEVSSPVMNRIYLFHMPLFFVISGILWNEEKYKDISLLGFIKKKFKSLIIPYFKIAIVCFVIRGLIINFFILNYESYTDALLRYIVGILLTIGSTEYMPSCSPIWFLTCLFFAELWICMIMKQKLHYLYVIVAIIIGVFIEYILKLPWGLGMSIRAVPFLYLGILIKRYPTLMGKKSIIICGVLSVAAMLGCNFQTNFASDSYMIVLYMLLTAPIISIFLLGCSKYVADRNLGGAKFLNQYVGRETLFLMGYNYLINPVAGVTTFHIPVLQALIGILILSCIKIYLNKNPRLKECFI